MALPFLPLLGDDKTFMTAITNPLNQRLETLLADGFSLAEGSLEANVLRMGDELPGDLRDLLLNLANGRTEKGDVEGDPIEFAFLCGQAYERLENFFHSRLAADIAFHAPDGTPPLELEKKDFAALSRFMALRNRALRTIADYTLKFLLVSAILLFMGLSLGLI